MAVLAMVLSHLISLAVNKAANALTQQLCQMWGMDDNRKKLHRHLLAVQEKIVNAEECGDDRPAVKEWLKELEAAAHTAVDVLDEFQYEALRRKAISEGASASASAKGIKGFFSSENPAVFRYKMSNKLTDVLGKIDEIVTEMNKFNLTPRDPSATPINSIDRETHSFVTESEIIGRDGEKSKIIREILDPQRQGEGERDNYLSVLAIVGMGGMGKTTLARLVFNDQRVKRHFELPLWVCVSTEFNVVNIMKSIIEVAPNKNGDHVSTSNKEVLQRQLCEILDRRRYMLVLDDVWNDTKENRDELSTKWEDLRMLLFAGAGSGSVIIVTTRDQRVASIMETLPRHDLAELSEEDAFKLFQKRAFGAWGAEPPEEFSKMGRNIADKCGGVPLAVETLGGLMASKQDVRDWRAISESNVWDDLDLQLRGNILPILKLSYHHLPPHIKQCFAFCAIFPQDYEMERDTLIQLWMANDFIPIDGGSMESLENKGRSIFNQLHWRSFFQNVKEKDTEYGSITTCQMHDLMHDLAKEIAGKKCPPTLEPNSHRIVQKEVQHLSLLGKKSLGFYDVLKQFPNIHTYLLGDYNYKSKKEEHSYLLKSCSLRAFQCRWEYDLPKELRYMKHIRYLDLSARSLYQLGHRLQTLPETICTLYNLQTLKLSRSKIRELPTEMRYMINLRHLFLDGCGDLKRMPIGLGKLTCLQTLTKYVVDFGEGVGNIGELNSLNLLGGHISLSGLEKVRDSKDAQTVKLAAKINLCSLELRWATSDNGGATRNDQAVLEALTPYDKIIKYLDITGYSGSSFSKWMMEVSIIKNLKRLTLEECINCAELPPLWQLPSLEDLYLRKMDNIISIVGSTCKHVEGSSKSLLNTPTFPALKVLRIIDLPKLESWREEDSNESVAFPELTKLDMSNCPKLKSLPAHAPLLESLSLEDMDNIISIVGSTCKHVEGSKSLNITTFPALKDLEVTNLPKLESWREEDSESVAFPELTKLKMSDCPRLKSLPAHVPLLADLEVRNCREIKLKQISNLPMLSNLDIGVDEPSAGGPADAFRPPKTLEQMTIWGFENVIPLKEEESQSISCQTKISLRKLDIRRSNCFFSKCGPGPSKGVALGFWKYYFAALEFLSIQNCDALVFWPEEELRSLKCLKELRIINCEKLIGSLQVQVQVQKEGGCGGSSSSATTTPAPARARALGELELESESMHIQLPLLESLTITGCPELVEVPTLICSKSLKRLSIWVCRKLSGEGLTHFMEHLQFPSLQDLIIFHCPGIESFPQGLQQRLPSLQVLWIKDCPALERRCRSGVGGDYCHLVSPIPRKEIYSTEAAAAEENTKWKISCCFNFRRDS